ncbi:CUB domain-containing protein 1 [Scleropages formosus]|uniref:CUB domain-containing protein 1 n=1 Tax=Scleropages formosus TaxID=113540 RepID=UPI000878E4E6|nr:CUB domain-containing protein 1 [Scleropages formosus]
MTKWRRPAARCALPSPRFLPRLLLLLLPLISECLQLNVNAGADTTVIVSTPLAESPCMVCLVQDGVAPEANCSLSLTVKPGENATLLFNCSEPRAIAVEIHKKVECTAATCSPAIAPTLTSLFKDFNKTFIWDLSSLPETTLGLDFSGAGLRGVGPSETCADGYRYMISSTQARGEAYCRQGPLTYLDLPSQATVSLQVPYGKELDSAVFSVVTKPSPKKGRVINITPETNATIILRKEDQSSSCTACSSKNSKPPCPSPLILKGTTVEFSCPQPQAVFSVEINKNIDCSATSCQGNIVQSEPTFFSEFNRSFTWDIKAVATKGFQVDFPDPGMRQISPPETCPDQYTYTLTVYQRSGPAVIGVFCWGGPIRKVKMLYRGRLTLQVPGLRAVDPSVFNISIGPSIKTLAGVFVELPNGQSTTDLFSPNYPYGFPDDDLMAWNISVPPRHNYTVKFVKYTEPQCLKKNTEVEYDWRLQRSAVAMSLSDPQPSQRQGSFQMFLRNCETDRSKDAPVLSLNFQVLVTRSSLPVLCPVDLPKEEGLTLFIKKQDPTSLCEMKMDSVIQEEITLRPGVKSSLSFQDCRSDELMLTGSKTIECLQWDKCPVDGTLLSIPTLASCLPTVLRNITWNLWSQDNTIVELLAPTGGLQQLLDGQECPSNLSLAIMEGGGVYFGSFCSGGPLSKVQVHGNISITATPMGTLGLSWTKEPFLNVTFNKGKKSAEAYVLTVFPGTDSPALLATPSWPQGMLPNSTVSWVVLLPPQQQAELLLTSKSQPRCAAGSSSVVVQALGSSKPMLRRGEGELAQVERVTASESFYVNVSNCMPKQGALSMLTKITVQRKSNPLLSIILGAVGALLLLLFAVLVVVCVVTRKKKGKKRVSIYNPNGNVFVPGISQFPKTRENNESHVYASIDETLIYGHLLKKTEQDKDQDTFRSPQTDVYRTFTGPMEGESIIREKTPEPEVDGSRSLLEPVPTMVIGRPRTPIERQESYSYTDPRMVDNELYTFKSNGDLGVRFLTLKEKEPEGEQQPQQEDDEFDDLSE